MSYSHFKISFHSFFIEFNKILKEKRKFLYTLFAVFLSFLTLLNFYALSFSTENVQLPDLSKIRPFSAEANYMSLDGFVAAYCRVNYGMDLSRGEARKMVKENLKAYARGIEQVTNIIEHQKEVKRQNIKKEARPVTISVKKECTTSSKHVTKNTLAVSNKKIVLMPFRNVSKNSKAPVEIVMHYAEKYFDSKGIEVINIIGSSLKKLLALL